MSRSSRLNVSVALCTYNGEAFLREQLQSIASQSRLPDELVLFDDHSKDLTLSIAYSFAQSAQFAMRIHESPVNRGPIESFSQAIDLCSGDVIVLRDQDD